MDIPNNLQGAAETGSQSTTRLCVAERRGRGKEHGTFVGFSSPLSQNLPDVPSRCCALLSDIPVTFLPFTTLCLLCFQFRSDFCCLLQVLHFCQDYFYMTSFCFPVMHYFQKCTVSFPCQNEDYSAKDEKGFFLFIKLFTLQMLTLFPVPPPRVLHPILLPFTSERVPSGFPLPWDIKFIKFSCILSH